MGCCVSTNNSSPPPEISDISKSKKSSRKQNGIGQSPLATCSPREEATAKEVLFLSETTTIGKFHGKNHDCADEKKHHHNGAVLKEPFMACGHDELSEVHSTAITEKKGNNGEFHETQLRAAARIKNRPFSGEAKRKNTAGKYSGRGYESSPDRDSPGAGYGRRNDRGESSERRSRSPVMRMDSGSWKTGLSSGISSRNTDTSYDRVGSGLGGMSWEVDDGKWGGETTWPPTSNELHENTHVSLECFIFL